MVRHDRYYRCPARSSRLLASLSYLGGASVLVLALMPRSPFVARHAKIALGLHLLRFFWSLVILVTWGLLADTGSPGVLGQIARDASLLLLVGIPWFSGIDTPLLLALSVPLSFTGLLALGGVLIALSGRTADISAFLHADWPDTAPETDTQERPRVDERARIRELTAQRLERMWSASKLAVTERRRVEQIERLEQEMAAVLSRLDNLNHLLSLGEISLGRFNRINAELVGRLAELRTTLLDLQERRADIALVDEQFRTAPSEGDLAPVLVRTLAIVDHSGIPLVTYGHFPLEETLITGMVAAFDSITAEMFGSRVHKTQLADGEVVYFVRGQATIAFVIFEDEPAPNQIVQFRDFLGDFEDANVAELQNALIDRSRLHQVPAPFAFSRRLDSQEPVMAEPGGPRQRRQ